MTEAWILLKKTFLEWREDGATQWGAALSYYVALSMAPILYLILFVGGALFGDQAVRGELVGQIQGTIGRNPAQLVQTILSDTHRQTSGIFTLVVSIGMLLVGATGVFGQLQKALNRMWEVKARPENGLLRMLKIRLLGLGMVVVLGVLLLVALVLSAVTSAAASFAQRSIPLGEVAARSVDVGAFVILTTILFAFVFKVLPDAEVRWRDVGIGAFFTGLLFTGGKYLMGFYLGHSDVGSSYGAASSLVVVLIWVYYSAQIMFFGAEFTQVWALRHGRQVEPSPHAVRIPEVH